MNDSKAEQLENALKKGGECNDPAVRPFLETADALRRDAETQPEHLDPATANNQRIVLMNMAQAQLASQSAKQEQAPKAPKPIRLWIGAIAGVLAVLIVAVVAGDRLKTNSLYPSETLKGDSAKTALLRMIIPVAHAGDAFTLVPESQDKNGASVNTTFKVVSKIDVTAETLQQSLRLVPALDKAGEEIQPVNVTVEQISKDEFRIKPVSVLDSNTVYKISLAAVVKEDDGTLTNRDFSWAIQTKNVFRVTSSIPGPSSAGVPVNTGIEFTMSLENWENPAPFFAIEPKVEGRFETHGRSLSFVPTKPLEYSRLYTVILKKDLKLKDGTLALAEDYRVQFETQPKPAEKDVKTIGLSTFKWLYETSPEREFVFRVQSQNVKGDVPVTGYVLNIEQAKKFLSEDRNVPNFASETRTKMFEKYATQKSFDVQAKLDESDSYYTYIRLPKIVAGRYILKFQPQGGQSMWLYVESSDVATYSVADDKTLMVWAMNIQTQRPLTDLPVAYGTASTKTDADGIARLPVPANLVSTSTNPKAEVIEVGTGVLSSLVKITSGGYMWDYYGYGMGQTNAETVSYLFADRPIYRTSDTVEMFGLVQDRQSKQASQNVTVEITRPGYSIYWGEGNEQLKVYKQANVTVDEGGFFQTKLNWTNLAPGYYVVSLKTAGTSVATRYLEIRDFVKPAYSLEVVTSKTAIFADEEVRGEVRAKFFDGTPVSNLALNLQTYFSRNSSTTNSELTTDETGRATFSFKTQPDKTCELRIEGGCATQNYVSFEVAPRDGEEADIGGYAFVSVYNSRVTLKIEDEIKGADAVLTYTVNKIDLNKLNTDNRWDVTGEPVSGAKITGKLYQREWKITETGTSYNYISKTTYPTYRYDIIENEIGTIDLTTDARGQAKGSYKGMKEGASYTLVANVKDEIGTDSQGRDWLSKGWMNMWETSGSDQYISLQETDLTPSETRNRHIGENVVLQLFRGKDKVPTSDTPSVLFYQAHLGLGKMTVTNNTGYEFKFGEEHVPNLTVKAVIFNNGGFSETQRMIGFDSTDRDLKIEVTADKTEYAPGAKAKFNVKVTDKTGESAKNARVVFSLVDEAVFAVPGVWDSVEYPLEKIYGYVGDGILTSFISHRPINEADDFYGEGGAEKGGGGGDSVRRNFKDTASFQMITTDRDGQGSIEVALPDNITSWRVTTVAGTPNLYAGSSRTTIKVTKPVFVDVVAPSVLLTQDKPILKLRAYGTGLKNADKVTFTVDAPTLGINKQSVDGVVGQSTYLAVDKLIEGRHPLVIRVTSSKGTDALEKQIMILSSRFARDEKVETELAPGVALPDPGTSPELEVVFIPKTRAQYLSRLKRLTYRWSERLESKFASRLARQLLTDYLGEEATKDEESLLRYQQPSGGLSILPYASEDVDLTSKIAALDTGKIFDHSAMAQYLWDVSQKQKVSREEALRALSGLAALGQPVLTKLNEYAEQKDLTWREQLAVIRGLTASGDTENARVKLEAFLAKGEDRGNTMMIRVSNDDREVTEATAETATYAALLAHPSAPKLNAWLERNWATDTLTSLDRIAYLARVVPIAVGGDVKIGYTVGGSEQMVDLEKGLSVRKVLTAEEVKAFRVTQINGPAVAVITRRVTDKPAQHKDISVQRSYGKAELKEADVVTVTLVVDYSALAPDGCYTLRDHLPAGMAPSQSYGGYYRGYQWYPNSIADNAVSFVVCRSTKSKQEKYTITYRARVISRGTYKAESAVLQSNEVPSVSALSGEETITIK